MPKGKPQGASRGSKLAAPKIQGKRSARPRRRNYRPWVPLQGLLNCVKKINKYVKDQSFSSKTMESTKGDNMSGHASKMAPRSNENNAEQDTKDKLLAIKTDITERIDPKKCGKRSVRPRGKEPAPWAPLHELHDFQMEQTKPGDDQDVCSKKMKMVAKGKKNTGSDNDVIKAETNIPIVDTLAEVKNGSGADANQQDSVLTSDTSVELVDNNRADADAIEQEDVLVADDVVADLKESNCAAAANALEQAASQTADATYPIEDKANIAKFDTVVSPLNGGSQGETFYASGAEAALASIYGEASQWDMCVTFAVKLLMDEAPVPEDAADVEDFFRQNMNSA